MTARVTIVIPCYNEADSLEAAPFAHLTENGMRLIFVDDGSGDETPQVLSRIVSALADKAEVLTLPVNRGKGEAVRQGLLRALDHGADIVGYLDADMSTPAHEALRLADILDRGGQDAVIGSRVAMLGYDIRRSPLRHYPGRVFATFASMTLDLVVYDTQCGAKFFRADQRLAASLGPPFVSRWVFDVELLGRLISGAGHAAAVIEEIPLRQWHDRGRSHVKPMDLIWGLMSLVRIGWRLRRWPPDR